MPPPDDAAAATLSNNGAPPDLGLGNRRLYAMSLMIISSVMISFGGLISRYIEGADASQINIYRSGSIFAVVLGVLVFQYRGQVVSKIMQIGWPGLIGGALLAVAGMAFMQALTTTTVANALFTLSAIPFFTAGLAWIFLREALSRVTVITMAVAAIGVSVMVGGGLEVGSFYGNAMALITAIGFAGFAVIVRKYRHIDMLPTMLVSGVILALSASAISHEDLTVSWHDFILCFIWGGILSGIGNVMFVIATRYLMAAEVTLFMLLEFALGPLWVWIFVSETPSIYTLAGGLLVMAAVGLRALHEMRSSRQAIRRGRLAGPT